MAEMEKKRNIKNIALIGFSATGKSSVAQKIAAYLEWQVVDLDNEIVKHSGKEIEVIFQQDGEEEFRRWEHEALERACKDKNTVIATGGGIILDQRNGKLLYENCMVIALEAKVDTIYNRLFENKNQSGSPDVRPLLSGKNSRECIRDLKSERQLLYTEAADITIHTDDYTTDEVCSEIVDAWNSFNRYHNVQPGNIWNNVACIVNTSTRIYPVFVGTDFLDGLGEKVQKLALKGRAIIISDSNVHPIYGERCALALEQGGVKAVHHIVPAGENSKSHDEALKIYDFMVREKIERDDFIVALGGGVVGDLAGFIAATYLRGISWIQVPTTLIAMVDASIGGKVAINHPKGKNLIGSFYQPHMVLADIRTLFTLPERELNSGWAEVIKHGMILDEELFSNLEGFSAGLKKLDTDITSDVIARSTCIKAQVVSEDEKEKGKRIILNYGHTAAHGLEATTGYTQFLHGEAVSIGMMVAAKISNKLDLIDAEIVRRQENLLRKFDLPVECSGISLESILQSMKLDKKTRKESVRWVLLEGIGKPLVISNIDEKIVIESLREVIKS